MADSSVPPEKTTNSYRYLVAARYFAYLTAFIAIENSIDWFLELKLHTARFYGHIIASMPVSVLILSFSLLLLAESDDARYKEKHSPLGFRVAVALILTFIYGVLRYHTTLNLLDFAYFMRVIAAFILMYFMLKSELLNKRYIHDWRIIAVSISLLVCGYTSYLHIIMPIEWTTLISIKTAVDMQKAVTYTPLGTIAAFLGLAFSASLGPVKRYVKLSQFVLLAVLSACIVRLFDFMFDLNTFYEQLLFFFMSMETACCLVLLCLGFLLVHPYEGYMEEINLNYWGGEIGRGLILYIFIIPVSDALIRLWNDSNELLGTVALHLTLIFVKMIFIIYSILFIIERLNGKDRERTEMEAEIRRREAQMKSLLEGTSAMAGSFDRDYKITSCNQPFISFFKNTFGVDVKEGCSVLLPDTEEARPYHDNWFFLLRDALQGNKTEMEMHLKIHSAEHYLQQTIYPIWEDGKVIGGTIYALDVTGQKLEQKQFDEQKALQMGILDNSGYAIIVTDLNLNITIFNKAAEQMTGLVKETVNQTMLAHFIKLDDLTVEEVFLKANEEGRCEVECLLENINGNRIPALLNVSLFQNYLLEHKGYICFISNISDKKAAQQELKTSEANLKALINNIDAPIWSLDKNLRLLVANEAFYALFEKVNDIGMYKKVNYVSKEILLVHPWRYEAQYKQAMQGESFTLSENWHIANNNKYIDFSFRPIYNEYDDVIGVTIFGKDVSAIHRQKEEAENTARIKTQFLSTMSHEIRTPLYAVISMANLLDKAVIDEEQQENLTILRSSSELLLSLLNDVLDVSKLEANALDLESRRFDFNAELKKTVSCFQAQAREKNLKLLLNLPKKDKLYLFGDPVRLSRIFMNLISNALKFTDEGSVQVQVEIKEELEGFVSLYCAVEDSGIGIEQDKFASIFEPFNQESIDIARKYGGTGLGLTIVRHLVHLMNGDIGVRRNPSKGVTFFFSLKFRKAEAEIPWIAEQQQSSKDYTTIFKGSSILVAEDNAVNRLVVKKILSQWNIKVDFALNGTEAFQKVQLNDYDWVLMDLQMSEMNGFEATRKIRLLEEQKYKTLPIMALSASLEKEVRREVFECGMNEFISKPFKQEDLSFVLLKYLKKNKTTTIIPAFQNAQTENWNFRDLFEPSSEELKEFITTVKQTLTLLKRDFRTVVEAGNGQALSELKHKHTSLMIHLSADQMSRVFVEAQETIMLQGNNFAADRMDAIIDDLNDKLNAVI